MKRSFVGWIRTWCQALDAFSARDSNCRAFYGWLHGWMVSCFTRDWFRALVQLVRVLVGQIFNGSAFALFHCVFIDLFHFLALLCALFLLASITSH